MEEPRDEARRQRRDQHDPTASDHDPFARPIDHLTGRAYRRRERIVAEIQANRRGEHTVPTWVLAAVLLAILAAFTVWMLLL